MPYTDAYGLWLELGQITPNTTDWQLFSEDTNDKNLFRFEFVADWNLWYPAPTAPPAYGRSYGLIRFHYLDDSGTFLYVTPQRKIYPKPEKLLLELKTFSDLIDHPYAVRKLAVRRKHYARYDLTGTSVDLPWSLKPELFQG